MIDKKTTHLKLPLPNVANELEDDCPRLEAALKTLDAHASAGDARLDDLETRASDLEQRAAGIEGDVVSVSGRSSALEAAMEEASGTLLSHGAELREHEAALSDLAVDKASKTELETVESSVNAISTMFIGKVFAHTASSTYVPNGCVPADGAEYAESQFPTFYADYLVAGWLLTCTYAEFAAQLALTGNCSKFALDIVNKKFKVPLYKDGDSITQAASVGELGKSVKAGLPNITGSIGETEYMSNRPVGALYNTGLSVTAVVGSTQTRTNANIGLDASRSNPIYGNSATVQTEGVRLRHFVVLATAQNSASVFEWSNYMAALGGKANKDLSNLDLVAEDVIRSKMTLRNLGTRTNTGTWTLTGVEIGRPLWIFNVPSSNSPDSHITVRVTSGAIIGAAAYADMFHLGRGAAWGSTNNLLIKPTASTIVLNVYSIAGSGTLYAEQV